MDPDHETNPQHRHPKVAVDIMSTEGRALFEGSCGEIVEPGDDGVEYDPSSSFDCALDLSQGTPRFYIMRLEDRGMGFDRITHHAQVTQCLSLMSPRHLDYWYLGVAAPTLDSDRGPDLHEDVHVFRIPFGVIVKLNKGTWHAGPLWRNPDPDGVAVDQASFFNLELSDTNVRDHTTHVFVDTRCEIIDT